MKYMRDIINVLSMLIGVFLFYCLLFNDLSDGVEFWVGFCAFVFVFIPLNDYK